MRSILALSVLLFLANVMVSTAQSPPNGDTSLTYVGSFTTTVTITCSAHSTSEDIVATTTVWRTVGNDIVFEIEPASVTFSGDCGDEIDNMSTKDLFDLLGAAAVARGYALGYISCSSSCGSPTTTKVYTASCVERSGSGLDTEFEECDETVHCYRPYEICCPSGPGTPSVSQLTSTEPTCSGTGSNGINCEPSCP